jgi:hypothetical protein
MAKYAVLLADGRTIDVYAGDEELAKKQALHQETTRIVIATKREHPIDTPPSFPYSVTKIKD